MTDTKASVQVKLELETPHSTKQNQSNPNTENNHSCTVANRDIDNTQNSHISVINSAPVESINPKLEEGVDMSLSASSLLLFHGKKSMPRYCEIQKGIQTLRIALPEIFEDSLVDFLYDHIINKYTNDPACDSQSRLSRSTARSEVNPVLTYLQNSQAGVTQDRIFQINNQNSYIPYAVNTVGRFSSTQNRSGPPGMQSGGPVIDQKAYIRRVVARAFCERSYGLEGLEQDIQEYNQQININKINYEGIMKQLVLGAIRTLQAFLLNECHLNIIHLLRRFDEGELVNCMLHCRVNFNGDICQIIFNIIKGLCELSKVTVTEADGVKLYNAIESKMNTGPIEITDSTTVIRTTSSRASSRKEQPMEPYPDFSSKMPSVRPRAKGKRSDKRAEAHDYMEQIWTSSHEARFVEMYRSGTSLALIRDTFKKQYPRESLVFTVSSLRSKLYRIVRTAIKKLYYFYDKHKQEGLPELVKLDDNKMKVIIHNTVGRLARKYLIEVYTLTKFDEKVITQAISGIMQCLKKERMQNQITVAHSRTSNESEDDYEEVMKKMKMTEND